MWSLSLKDPPKDVLGLSGLIPQLHERRQTRCLSHMGLRLIDTYPHWKFRKIILDNGFGGRGFHRGCG